MSPKASRVVVAVSGIVGGWFGYWLGQDSMSVWYLTAEPTTSTAGPYFAWWSKDLELHTAGLQQRLAYLADAQLYPLWRFLLSIGLAALFACLAGMVVTRLPLWRARRLLQTGAPTEATVVRVQETGESVVGPAGVERQLVLELYVRAQGSPPYRARTVQFVTETMQQALQPGTRVMARYSQARPDRVAVVGPLPE